MQLAFIETSSLLDNEKSNNILNIILLNYGEDIFILCNNMNNSTILYYIIDFRKNNKY